MDRPITGERAQAGTIWRSGFVLLLVLALHAAFINGIRNSLALAGPAEFTQTTMMAALLRPPPPIVPPRPAPPTARTPTIASKPLPAPIPPAPIAPEPAPESAPVESPEVAIPEVATPEVATEAPSPQANANKLPTQGRIAYRTVYSRMAGMEAMTFVDWAIDREKSRYELWLRTVDPVGLLDLRSNGELRPFGIAPFKYVERIDIVNRQLSVEFDWVASLAHFAGRGAGEPAQFAEGTQDPLSLQFHLPLLAQTYPWRFTPGAEIQFSVARRRIETYTFTVVGYETIQVRDRDINTLKIERRKGPGANRQVELWMAPEFDWLPARLRFVDANDEVWESVLAHLPGSEQPPPEPVRQQRADP